VTLSLADIAYEYNQRTVNVEALLHRMERQVAWHPSQATRHDRRNITSLVGRIMLALQPHLPDCILAAPGSASGGASNSIHIRDESGRALISFTLPAEWDDHGQLALNEICYHCPKQRSTGCESCGGHCPLFEAPETIRQLATELKKRIGDSLPEYA
jgi:hypothetical protein